MPVPILESELQNEEFSQISVDSIIAAAEKTRDEETGIYIQNLQRLKFLTIREIKTLEIQ